MFEKMELFSKSIPKGSDVGLLPRFSQFDFCDVSTYAAPLVFILYRIMNQRYCFSLFWEVACDYQIIEEFFIGDESFS